MSMVRMVRPSGATSMRTMAVDEFKADCLAVIVEVNATGHSVLLTERGQPLARILPLEGKTLKENPESIFGCLRHMGEITGDILSSEFKDEEWDRMFNERLNQLEKGPKQ